MRNVHTTGYLEELQRRREKDGTPSFWSRHGKLLSALAGIGTAVEAVSPGVYAADTGGLTSTITDIFTYAQIGGLGISGIFLVFCGIKLGTGGRQGLEESKGRILGVVIGIIIIAGASGLKAVIQSFNHF